MQAEPRKDDESAEKPIGLPESLRNELGQGPLARRASPSARLIASVPAPPDEAEALPLWAVVFLTGTAVLAAAWLAAMAAVALRVLGWT